MPDQKKTIWDLSSINLQFEDNEVSSETQQRKCVRKFPRINLLSLNKILEKEISYLPVKMATTNSGQCKGMILDFSENGCRIAVPVQLNKGEVVKVGFIINKTLFNLRI